MNKQSLAAQISKMFNGATVTDVQVDSEFGNVTATVNGKKNVDCGFIEDYNKWTFVGQLFEYEDGELCGVCSCLG